MRTLRNALIFLTLTVLTATLHAQAAPRVVNAGFPGETTAEIHPRLAAFLQREHPNYVVVYIGMNDAVNPAKFLPLAETIRNFGAILDDIQRSKAIPILVIVQHVDTVRVLTRHDPKDYGPAGPNGKVDALDRELLQLAAERKVATADFRTALDQAGGPTNLLSTDGTHLNPKGYHLLASTVRAVLPAQLATNTVVLCLGDSLTYGTGVRPPNSAVTAADGSYYPAYPAQLETMLKTP